MDSPRAQLRPTLVLLGLFSVLTGLAYPLAITGIAQAVFPRQAAGSLVIVGDQPAGSELVGQPFDNPAYFWGRPSATSGFAYNAAASSGSNLGTTSAALLARASAQADLLRELDPAHERDVPVDLVTASGSGLDPHISLAGAYYQARRVASVRGLALSEVNDLIDRHAERPFLGIFGEPRVNVLLLNLALDGVQSEGP